MKSLSRLFFLIAILFIKSTFGQQLSDYDYFAYLFEGSDDAFFVHSLLEHNQATYVNATTEISGKEYPVVFKQNEEGDIVWSKQITSMGEGAFLRLLEHDDHLYGIGRKRSSTSSIWYSVIVKLDTNGNILTQKYYEDATNTYLRSAAFDQNGNLIVVGFNASRNATFAVYIAKFDNQLDLQWHRELDTDEHDYANGLVVANDGSLLVTGNIGNSESSRRGFIAYYTAQGILSWVKQYSVGQSSYMMDYEELSNGKHLIVGRSDKDGSGNARLTIVELDENYDLSDIHYFSYTNFAIACNVEFEADRIRVLGYADDDTDRDIIYLELDTNYTVAREKRYEITTEKDNLKDYRSNEWSFDGNTLLGGGHTNPSNGIHQGFVFRTDIDYNIGGITTDITYTSSTGTGSTSSPSYSELSFSNDDYTVEVNPTVADYSLTLDTIAKSFNYLVDTCMFEDRYDTVRICIDSVELVAQDLYAYSYLWSNGDSTNRELTVDQGGAYWVKMKSRACPDTIVQHFYVEDTCLVAIWPGDCDNDGNVDVWDIIPIGITYGSGPGPVRNYADNMAWEEQYVESWGPVKIFLNDAAHIDANGDGWIDEGDAEVIDSNYNFTHNRSAGSRDIQDENDPLFYIDMVQDSVLPGDTLEALVRIGSDIQEISNFFSLAYRVNFNPDYIQDGSVEVEYNNSLLGEYNQDFIALHKIDDDGGLIDIGMTRINYSNISGHGDLAKIIAIIDDDIGGGRDEVDLASITFGVSEIDAFSNNQSELGLNNKDTVVNTAVIYGLLDQVKEYQLLKANISPNPSNGVITITLSQNTTSDIRVYDAVGRLVISDRVEGNISKLDISALDNGIYMVIIDSEKGVVQERLFVH